jgi:hypothetical protein
VLVVSFLAGKEGGGAQHRISVRAHAKHQRTTPRLVKPLACTDTRMLEFPFYSTVLLFEFNTHWCFRRVYIG